MREPVRPIIGALEKVFYKNNQRGLVVTNQMHRSIGLPPAFAHARAMVPSVDSDMQVEQKAARMHMLNRTRGRHFVTPAMADSSLDIMLSLFVGELQQRDVSETTLATANLLSRKATSTLIDKLVQAGLVVLTGHEPDGRTVGLSPLGSARMRSFVNDYPDV